MATLTRFEKHLVDRILALETENRQLRERAEAAERRAAKAEESK